MTTREEQRDVERDVLSTLAEWRETIRAWSGSAFVAGEDVGDTAGAREQLYLDLCRIGNETAWMEDEIIHLRASQAGGVPAGWPTDGIIMKDYWRDAIGSAYVPVKYSKHASWHPTTVKAELEAHRGEPVADVLAGMVFTLSINADREDLAWKRVAELEAELRDLRASPPPPATALAAWQDISTAPKDGTWVLCLAKRATVPVIASHQFSTGGIGRWIDKDASDFSGHDDPSEAWIEYWNSNSYTPTHWMPLPPRPDDRTNASEAQSGSLNQALPASSVSATDAVEAERRKFAKARTDIQHLLAIIDFTAEATGEGPDDADAQMIADIRADYGNGIRARGTENGEQS